MVEKLTKEGVLTPQQEDELKIAKAEDAKRSKKKGNTYLHLGMKSTGSGKGGGNTNPGVKKPQVAVSLREPRGCSRMHCYTFCHTRRQAGTGWKKGLKGTFTSFLEGNLTAAGRNMGEFDQWVMSERPLPLGTAGPNTAGAVGSWRKRFWKGDGSSQTYAALAKVCVQWFHLSL